MAKKTLKPLEELPFSEPITVNFSEIGGSNTDWRFKEHGNFSTKADDKTTGFLVEVVTSAIIDEQQAEFRKEFTKLWNKDKISAESAGELLEWVDEERTRLRKEAVAAAAGRPTGAPSDSGS